VTELLLHRTISEKSYSKNTLTHVAACVTSSVLKLGLLFHERIWPHLGTHHFKKATVAFVMRVHRDSLRDISPKVGKLENASFLFFLK